MVDLTVFRDDGRAELLDILTSLPGTKCMVVESQIVKLLNHIIPEGPKLLKENGVLYFRELRSELGDFVDANDMPAEPEHIIYLVRPSVAQMKVIATHINARTRAGAPFDFRYKVYFVPHRTFICEQVLREEGVLRRVDIGEYPLDLVPLDTDLMSLEMEGLFRECCLEGDTSGLTTVAKSLHKVQTLFGPIPSLRAKGSAAHTVLARALHMQREDWDLGCGMDADFSFDAPLPPEIDALVLLDREVDLASALVTPLTYEGLIDEIIGIVNGYVKLDAALLGEEEGKQADGSGGTGGTDPADESGGKRRQAALPLNSSDPLFAVVRDLNVEQLGPFLQNKAKEIRQSYAAFRSNRDQSIGEIHDFVKKIPGLTQVYKSLTQHINIAELVKRTTDSATFRQRWQAERAMLEGEACYDQIEDAMCQQAPPREQGKQAMQVLRLLCLQSVTGGGVRGGRYDQLRRDIVQTYGYEHLFTLQNLEATGLLKRREMTWVDSGGSTWNTLRRSLRLINDSVGSGVPAAAAGGSSAAASTTPDDVAYVSSGYAPLSVRLVQAAARPAGSGGGGGGGWAALADVMRLLPGPTVEVTQGQQPEELATLLRLQAKDAAASGPARDRLGSGGDGYASTAAAAAASAVGSSREGKKKVMILYMIGGLTYMEVAALRFLSQHKDFKYEIIMATTKVINGNSFINSLTPGFTNNLIKS